MDINIKLESFEGPMDLLYSLIIKNKIDIYDIPIVQLTDQYLEYVDAMERENMESISEFIVMAATLIEIKSKMLLPKEVDENNVEIDPREELVNRLVEYKKFKSLAKEFDGKQKLAGYTYFKDADKAIINKVRKDVPKEISDILSGADMKLLMNAFDEVLKRQEVKVDKIRSKFKSVEREEFTVESKIEHLRNLLKLEKEISFFKIFDYKASKGEVVATFLAVLELIRNSDLKIKQNKAFSDIIMYFDGGAENDN